MVKQTGYGIASPTLDDMKLEKGRDYILRWQTDEKYLEMLNQPVLVDPTYPERLEKELGEFMYQNLPDPDLIVRTGGQMRLSNFLLFQSAYSELVFSDTLWPDIDEKELDGFLNIYQHRNRNFGEVRDTGKTVDG